MFRSRGVEAEGRKHKTLDHKTIFSWVLFNNTKAEVYFRAAKPDRVAATRVSSSGGGSVANFTARAIQVHVKETLLIE